MAGYYQKNYMELLEKKLQKKRVKHLATMMRAGKNENRKDTEHFMKGITDKLSTAKEYKVNCILEVVRLMISDHLCEKPHAIVLRLNKLLKNIAEHADVEITAHTKDAQEIRNGMHKLTTSAARKMLILDDPSFDPGSLLIKANKSIVDAHLHTEIERAKELLLS